MATIAFSPCRWSTKQYILAAIFGTITAAAIVTVVSFILRPATIQFSITLLSSCIADGELKANLTVAATNPSRRAGVLYRSIVVSNPDVTADTWTTTMYSVKVQTPLYQPPWNRTIFAVSVLSLDLKGDLTLVTVLVTAKVQFMVGLACSWPYEMTVACKHINFTQPITDATINCTG